MKIRRLRTWLKDILNDGYGPEVLNFSDQDNDYYTVNDVFIDDDGDVCLQSSCGYEMTVDDIVNEIADCDDDTYVYFEHLYWDDSSLICDIEGGWYTDDDGDVTIDVVYHNDEDDDDYEDDY